MLTAKVDIESKLEGLEQGADAHLVKPFQKAELLVRLKNLLKSRKKLQAYYQKYIASDKEKANENGVKVKKDIENSFSDEVTEHVLKNLHNMGFGVEGLCKEMGMSRSQLHRKLCAAVGRSPNKFTNAIRLNNACAILSRLEINVADVAYRVGFSDPSYFTRSFKKEFGRTPMEYRQKITE